MIVLPSVTTAVISWSCRQHAIEGCGMLPYNSVYKHRLDLVRGLQFTDLCPSVPGSKSTELAGIRT